jgi:hypothetical protein
MGREQRVLVVVGELEPGDEQEAVLDVRAPGFLLELAPFRPTWSVTQRTSKPLVP